MATDIGQRLLDLKKKIEREKSIRAEYKGELKNVMTQLEEEFAVDNLEKAEKMLKEKEADLKKMGEQLQADIERLEELMENAD